MQQRKIKMWNWIVFISIQYVLDCSQSSAAQGHTPTIVNPNGNTLPNEAMEQHPYSVALVDMSTEKGFCTAALIDNDLILTAAHCFYNRTSIYFSRTRLASLNCSGRYIGCAKAVIGRPSIIDFAQYDDGEYIEEYGDSEEDVGPIGEVINITDVFIHELYFEPEFSNDTFANDIAILVLADSVIFNKYQNVSVLAPKDFTFPQDGTILGYGKRQFKANFTSNDLNTANVTLLDRNACQTLLDADNVTFNLSPGIVCSYGQDANGSSPCNGDSGGPLICQPSKYLCGIISASDECKPEKTALYSSVSFHREWIETTIRNIRIFSRERLSLDLWRFQAHLTNGGRILSMKELLAKLLNNAEFRYLFILACRQVPLEHFSFEMNDLSKANWNKESLFLLRKTESFRCRQHEKQFYVAKEAVIPCESEKHALDFGRFLRHGSKDQAMDFVQKFAEVAYRAVEHDNFHVRKITTSFKDLHGIYIVIDIMNQDHIDNVTLQMDNSFFAGGYNISGYICNDGQCCNASFGDMSPGSAQLGQLEHCDEFRIRGDQFTVKLKSNSGDQFKAKSLKILTKIGRSFDIEMKDEWVQFASPLYYLNIKKAPLDISSPSNLHSFTLFPLTENSSNALHFKAATEGEVLVAPREFLEILIGEEKHVSRELIRLLKTIPFEEFTFTLNKINKATWERRDYAFMFKVERLEVLHPNCTESTQVTRDQEGAFVISPCIKDHLSEWKTYNMATFVRTANESRVMQLFAKMAREVYDQVMVGGRSISVSSTFKNTPGTYLVIHGQNDGIFLAIGGYISKERKSSDLVESIHNLSSFKHLTNLPRKIEYAVGGLIKNHPIVCGGLSTSYEPTLYKECYKLSLDGSKWINFANMSTERGYGAGLVLDNCLWISGGAKGSNRDSYLKTTEMINFDGTTLAGKDLIEPLAGHCTVQSQNQIFIIGGSDQLGPKRSTRIFNFPLTTSMKCQSPYAHMKGPDLNLKRSLHGCTAFSSANHEGRNVILVVGGIPHPKSAELLDHTQPGSTWIEIKGLPKPMWHKPGLYPSPVDNESGVIIVYQEDIFKLIVHNNEYKYETLEIVLKEPRDGFVALTSPALAIN